MNTASRRAAVRSAGQLPLLAEPPRPIPALSFWRPWSEALVTGVKQVEFRTRPPPRTLLGVPLVVVAVPHFDADALAWLAAHCGVAWDARPRESFACGLVGMVTITGCRDDDDSNPQFGRHAWIIEHPVAFAVPIPHPGAQGVRYLDGEVAARVREAATRASEPSTSEVPLR